MKGKKPQHVSKYNQSCNTIWWHPRRAWVKIPQYSVACCMVAKQWITDQFQKQDTEFQCGEELKEGTK